MISELPIPALLLGCAAVLGAIALAVMFVMERWKRRNDDDGAET